MNIHEKYINRCIEIAKNGLGTSRPNPMVGCVIVLNDVIIGEGFTSAYGGNHAEVNAIASINDKSLLKNTILYVTLEPCSHFGKTPPCSDLIIKHEIPKVVIGTKDINRKVSGKGIEKLINSGCDVTIGVLEEKCKEHHKRFFTFHNKKRPYIILKWAQTLDGFIAPKIKNKKKPVWISNAQSRQLNHKWRTQEQAILVGINTVLEDNPSLTARDWKGQNPIRIILDKNEIHSKEHNVFNNDVETLLIKETDAKAICKKLYQANINSLIVEGGAKTLQLFINSGLWDEARVFTGNKEFHEGIKAPKFYGELICEEHIEDDILKIYSNS